MKRIFTILMLATALCSCADEMSTIDTASLPKTDEIKSIPLPPAGERWVVNEQFSDEFNGDDLDESKWYRCHPTWIGREPGLFMPENVAFRDGCMVLHGEKMDRDTVIKGTKFNISCAAVISKTREAHYGYYECRFKANKATLSSTFWLSTPAMTFDTEGRQPEGSEVGKFRQELDICECIGRKGDFTGVNFANGMNSNMHYWFSPEGKGVEDRRAKEARLIRPDGALLSEDFNTFGCWWRDAESASFYLNDAQQTDRQFIARKSHKDPYDCPFRFTEPMHLNMVVETYPYPWIELPNDEELADPARNSTLYDWVRSYVLVDVADANKGAAPMEMFEDEINIAPGAMSAPLSIRYTASVDRKIRVASYDASGKRVTDQHISAPAGYANMNFDTDLNEPIAYIVAYLTDADNTILCADSYVVK